MVDEVNSAVTAGQAVYKPSMLAIYDRLVIGYSNRFVWQCDTATQIGNYQSHIGTEHLEIGAGTGYYLDRCRFPASRPALTLLDLNPAVLRYAARRLARYRPEVVRANALEPLPVPPASFDSVAVNYLLHCLPGDWAAKEAVLVNAAEAARPGGTVFGATLLSRGVDVHPRARRWMDYYNRKGMFHNAGDGLADLRATLTERFAEHDLVVQGCAAVFSARTRG
jgi:ubiquinone/menaquinone biosynthesis C-methylase UbiE